MENENSAHVVNSHVLSCPSCGRDHAVAVVWSDGDVDIICSGCKYAERFGVN